MVGGGGVKEENKEEEKEEEKEIKTPLQSFAAMQHSLLMGLGYRVLHFFSEQPQGGGGGGD